MIFKLEKVMCLIVTALLILLQITCQDQTEVDFLCANDDCTEHISEFRVHVNYIPNTHHKISATRGEEGHILKIFKDAEINLFEVQIKGKKGFLPANIVEERGKRKEDLITKRLTIPRELILNEKSSKPDRAANDRDTPEPVSSEIDNLSLVDPHNETNSELDSNINNTKTNVASTADREKSQSDESIAPNDNSRISDNQRVDQSNQSDSTPVEQKSDLNNDTIGPSVNAQEAPKIDLQSGQNIAPNDDSQLSVNQHVDQNNQSDSTLVEEKSEPNNDTISPPVSDEEAPKIDLQSGQNIAPSNNSQLSVNQHVDQSNQSDSTPVAIKSENVKESSEIIPANTEHPVKNSVSNNNLNHDEANSSDSVNSNLGHPSTAKQSDESFTSTVHTSDVKSKPNIDVRKPKPYAYMNAHQTKPKPPRNQVKNSEESENNTSTVLESKSKLETSDENKTTQSSSRIDGESSEVRENVTVETNTSGAIPVGSEMPRKNSPEPAESLKSIDSHQEINAKAQVTKRESLPSVPTTEHVPETKPVETVPATEGTSSIVNDSEILERTDESRNPSETYMRSNINQEPAQQHTEPTSNEIVDTPASDDLKQVTSDSNSSPNDSQKAIESDKTHIPVETVDRAPSVPFRIPLAHQPMQSVDNVNDVSSSVSDSSEGEENATDASQPLPVSVSNTESENNFSANVQENIQNKIPPHANYEQIVQMKSQQIPPPDHPPTPSDQNIIPLETSTSPTIDESSSPSVPKVEESASISPPAQSTDQPIHGYYGTPSISSSFSATPEGQLEPNDNLSDKSILTGTPESLNSDSKFSGESKPDIQSETTTLAFDTDEKHSLNDFIHGPRKKVNENDAETVDNQEKSIYETIQEYLPDFGGFDIGNVLPKDSMEQFFGIFDFKKTSQEQEETNKEFCEAESFCGTDRLNSFVEPHMTPSHQSTAPSLWGEISDHNKEQIVWTSGVVSVILFGLILFLYLIDSSNKKNRSKLLVSKINDLEKKLMISSKEIASLQEQLIESNSQANEKQNIVETKRISEVYEHKMNQYKKRIVELEDKVSYLEKELEDVAGSALEMHKLLENSLTTQAYSKAAIDEMETLRSLTESQEMQIEELKKEINAIITENQCLKVDSEMDKSAIKKLEKECSTQTKKNLELSEKNRNLTLQLDKEIENNNALENNYKSEIYQLRSKLEDVEMNLKRSEFQVQELNRAFLDKQEGKTADEKMAACDEMQLKMQVATLEAMNVELGGQLKEEKNARRMLEDHVGDIIKELNNLKKTYESSEKERNEAVTKLQVLTQYFKDKEAQLRKELEAKDKLYSERESKDQSLSQKLAFMREEINTLKTVNEELKKEIHDQEASYKLQLANAEQKTREHWFALRQAERKYKECQQEAASLRNKILVLENSLSSINQKPDDKNNSVMNGDVPAIIPSLYHSSVSPELLPFPPSEFIPPPPSPIPSRSPDFFPPEPLYSPDERLPPLGGRRAPTPPPPIIPDDDEFSPPPPNMKYAAGRNRNVEPPAPYSRRTPPPNSRHRSFKPKPRSSIDSPSSGMSLESLDKSGR